MYETNYNIVQYYVFVNKDFIILYATEWSSSIQAVFKLDSPQHLFTYFRFAQRYQKTKFFLSLILISPFDHFFLW